MQRRNYRLYSPPIPPRSDKPETRINVYTNATTTTTASSLFRQRIEELLGKWHQLQEKKFQYLPAPPSSVERSCSPEGGSSSSTTTTTKETASWVRDDFDRAIEEDMENRLKELEVQEDDDYRSLTGLLEQQLTHDNSKDAKHELEQYSSQQLEHVQRLQRFMERKQQPRYQEFLRKIAKFEQCAENSPYTNTAKKPTTGNGKPWRQFGRWLLEKDQTQKNIIKEQQKQLQYKLDLLKANQMKTKRIIDLVESHWKINRLYGSFDKK